MGAPFPLPFLHPRSSALQGCGRPIFTALLIFPFQFLFASFTICPIKALMVQEVLLIGLVTCSFLVPPLGLKAQACSLAIYILCLVLAFYSWEGAPPLGLVHVPSPLQHTAPFFALFAFSNYKTSTLIVQAPFLPITSSNVPQGTNCTQ